MTKEEIKKKIFEIAKGGGLISDAIIELNLSRKTVETIAKEHGLFFRSGNSKRSFCGESIADKIVNYVKENEGAVADSIVCGIGKQDGGTRKTIRLLVKNNILFCRQKHNQFTDRLIRYFYTKEYAEKNFFCVKEQDVDKKEEELEPGIPDEPVTLNDCRRYIKYLVAQYRFLFHRLYDTTGRLNSLIYDLKKGEKQ